MLLFDFLRAAIQLSFAKLPALFKTQSLCKFKLPSPLHRCLHINYSMHCTALLITIVASCLICTCMISSTNCRTLAGSQFGGSQFGGSQFGGSQFGGSPYHLTQNYTRTLHCYITYSVAVPLTTSDIGACFEGQGKAPS